LFHPADGQVRVKGVTSCPNSVLHPWLKQELTDILASLPQPSLVLEPEANRALWEMWFEGLSVRPTLPAELPPLRMLLIVDNLKGHKSPDLVQWLFEHGIIPLYTPLGGSWLNMAESIQRILKRRALDGQHPTTPVVIINWLEPQHAAGIVTPRLSSGVANEQYVGRVAASDGTLWVAPVPAPADQFGHAKPL
jgi:hypothetical protein